MHPLTEKGIPRDGEEAKAGAVPVFVKVSPCSWMHAGYGLQLQFKLPSDPREGNSGEFVVVAKKPWAEITRADYDAGIAGMVAKIANGGTAKCPQCGAVTWSRKVFHNQYRDDRCEGCFLKGLHEEFDAAQRKMSEAIKAEDERRKKQGYTHKVDAWIHPSSGDDFQVTWYWKGEPDLKEVARMIKKKRSTVLTDFKVTSLP